MIEKNFILHNNRSINGVVKNFLPKNIDINSLIRYETVLRKCQEGIELPKYKSIPSDLNVDFTDISYTISDLKKLKNVIIDANNNISDKHIKWLNKQKITKENIDYYMIGTCSSITDLNVLEVIGATLNPLFNIDIKSNDCLLFPLFNSDKELINCLVYWFDNPLLKTTLSCPDIDIFGLNLIEDDSKEEIYIVDNIIDMIKLNNKGYKVITTSNIMWSGIQVTKLLDRGIRKVKIICDLKNKNNLIGNSILNKFMGMFIESNTYIMNDNIFETINITDHLINSSRD